MLNEASSVYTPPPEQTLFSVGGRGHYENPTSDLLAFFMKPKAEHGLGDMFLTSFLECLGASELCLQSLESVTIDREVTYKGGRIDLVIQGHGWCLIIENKIFHSPVNPFDLYEEYARTLPGITKQFAILSPGGASERNNWTGVSYKKYLKILGQRLSSSFLKDPLSKWHLFAREFIIHIQNLLYTPSMNDKQVEFIENHIDQISKIKEMDSQYQNYICETVIRRLNETIDGGSFAVNRENTWPGCVYVFRCKSPQWENGNDMVFFLPKGVNAKFLVRVYLADTEEQRSTKAIEAFHWMKKERENKYLRWTSTDGYDSTESAIEAFCKAALSLTEIHK